MVIPPGAFLLLRHGETEANAQEIICGKTDLPLTPRGRDQAARTADFLALLPLTRIVSSPLLRARQTAQAVAERTGLTPELLPGLAERDWGAWEGRPRAILRRDIAPPGGESPEAFRARIRAAFARLDLSQPVLIVAHSGTAREIHALLSPAPHRRLFNAEVVLWKPEAAGWCCHECFRPEG